MTVYYVSTAGSDASNGLGPDASHGTNKPWLTLGKLLGATGMASGDTAYVGPGVCREVITVNMTSATVETIIAGDPWNVQGFKDGSGVKLAPGEIQHTAYVTNDKTAASGTNLLNLNGRDFLHFKNMTFVQGSTTAFSASASTDMSFTDCAFIAGHHANPGNMFSITGSFGVALDWTFDRCRFLKGGSAVFAITLPTGVGADYDTNFVIKNACVLGGSGTFITVSTSGTSANEGGGVDALNCTMIAGGTFMSTGSSRNSLTFPCTVNNCFIYSGSGSVFNATEAGAITEDYNLILAAATPRTNVTAGANSISDGSYAPMFFFGQEAIWGAMTRPMGMPTPLSPILGFGDNGSAPATDIFSRPRPAGGEYQ